MKIHPSIVILILFSFLLGCSNRYALVTEEYQDKIITGKSLGIVNLFDKPIIYNPKDVIDDLGKGNPETVYMDFFKDRFVTAFRNSGSFQSVNYVDNNNKLFLNKTDLKLNDNENMIVRLPTTIIKSDSFTYDFILFIDSLIISRETGTTQNFTPNIPPNYAGPDGRGAYDKLYQGLQFVLWDNTQAKIVSYGDIIENSDIYFGTGRGNWDTLIFYLSKKILRFSPFPFRTRIGK